ncbi:MAG: hypothetical protein HY674_16410 [Chloroflexi bacterium]|nr:hypothetical protein [Chloroflexota bacterium]
MKKLLPFLAGLAFLAPATILGGNTAEIRLHCYSLRFQPATVNQLGTYTLEITGNPSSDAANGELRLMPIEIPYTHGGIFLLLTPFDPITAIPMPFYLDTPFTDEDNNGLIDDFEVSRSISGTTTGVYEDWAFGESPLQATWIRAANSKNGTCRLTFPDLGLTFNHTFEVIEYAGTLSYTNAGANISGAVQMTQVQDADNKLEGTLALTKENANLLPVTPGSWTHSSGKILAYQATDLERFQTNYLAYLLFDDGEPATEALDFVDWDLVVVDSNDANGNGIPDLSDVPQPIRPELSVSRTQTHLLFKITGEIGRLYDLEESGSLTQPAWTTASTVILSANSQELQWPLPAGQARFYRLKAP